MYSILTVGSFSEHLPFFFLVSFFAYILNQWSRGPKVIVKDLRPRVSFQCSGPGCWSASAFLPLPGDQVDVVSQSGVVLGQLFGRSVFTRVLWFGRIGICQCSQAHQHAQEHGHQHAPRLQHHGHLQKEQPDVRAAQSLEGTTLTHQGCVCTPGSVCVWVCSCTRPTN